jgi:hypothetical protein
MAHRKKTDTGVNERLALLREVFPNIQRHFEERPSGVARTTCLMRRLRRGRRSGSMARKWIVVNMPAKNSRVSNSQIEPNWVIEMTDRPSILRSCQRPAE